MPCRSRKLRLLLLLALMQVAAGPMVLVGVGMMGKVLLREVSHHGLVRGLSLATADAEWRTSCDLIAPEVTGATSQNSPGGKSESKSKTQDGKAKMAPIYWSDAAEFPILPREPVPIGEPVHLACSWSNGPPAPPPRRA